MKNDALHRKTTKSLIHNRAGPCSTNSGREVGDARKVDRGI